MSRNAILISTSNRTELLKALNTLIVQLPVVFSNTTIPIKGVMMTIAQLLALMKAAVSAIETAEQTKATAHNAAVAAETQIASVRAVVPDIQDYARLILGPTSNQLALLGFAPPKKAVKSVAVKAEAIAKSAATRQARGTKGKDEKEGIHGTVAPEPAGETPSAKK
jgi:hypothetical protein